MLSDKEKFDILNNMSEDELEDADVLKFRDINKLFEYLYDEYTTKADLIADMTEDMKRQIVQNHYDERVIESGGEYFYSTEMGNVDFGEDTEETDMDISVG